jgi:hypothetical protein
MNRTVYVSLTGLAALVCTAAWLWAAIHVAGIWLDCLPNSTEYPCPTPVSAWEHTLATIAAVTALTVLVGLAARRLTKER